ncbi:MAG: ABC transporter ATP-binding protein [Deltaproteobacteria bacterium]|nr:ABC transporter ATP-binding protein [Deltaproteobacteria bacterium]
MDAPTTPVVSLRGITKVFGAVRANSDICLDIHAGRIKALLGENGAGKSTLMSILAGHYHPDAGEIRIDGQARSLHSTKDAIRAGIGMVYQHFMLVEAMTVAENVFLGQEPGFMLSPARMRGRVRELAASHGLDIDPAARVADLSMGEKQRVEILKLLQRQSRILIFDEPTAVLTPQEGEQLFTALRHLAGQGKAIVYISHKLGEVMALADDIAILRKGRIVDEMPAAEVRSQADLARRMVGREVLLDIRRQPVEPRQHVLRLDAVSAGAMREVSLAVRQGEILAIVGVAGNGQKDLVETVCGLRTPDRGEVAILGKPWPDFFAAPPWQGGLSYIPEDRQGLATCRNMDLVDNFLLTTRQGYASSVWLKRDEARGVAQALAEQFKVSPPDVSCLARQLSGGNLQKMVLAREFHRRPRLIVAEQPTQGLDVSAIEDVWTTLLAAREEAGILLVTGDLSEALALADRVAVMFEGRVMDTFPVTDQARVERIGQMMAGMTADDD